MQNLFNPADRAEVSRRLDGLQAASPRQWGKMTAAQALAHCAATLEMACGERPAKRMLVGRLLAWMVKPSVLGEKPFTRGAPTSSDFRVVDECDFAAERQRLTALLERFCTRGPSAAEGLVHTFFGRLHGEEWGRLMYKHLDHHLRQFGA